MFCYEKSNKRIKSSGLTFLPLASIIKTTKQDILDWWSKQPFDLNLEEHYGNCITYHKNQTQN